MTKQLSRKERTIETLKTVLKRDNVLSLPKLEKIIVSVGVGKKHDKKWTEHVVDRITKITGQHPVIKAAKKSIASFKVRAGDASGVIVTLRGERMYAFLEKLLMVAFPRTRDFRGIPKKIIDEMGNATLGLREHVVFPETTDEELKDVFGMSIIMTTSAKDKKEAEALFTALGVPFKKN